jgi:ferric-dicitrate binding protein FerR (iron transport regulator)
MTPTQWEPAAARVRSDADGTTYEVAHSDGTRVRVRFRDGIVHVALLDGRWGIVRAGPVGGGGNTGIDLERRAESS